MERKPCCAKEGLLNRGPWSREEDICLSNYIKVHGEGRWSSIPMKAGLLRSGKSCRLRWMNYLSPNVKRGDISSDEEDLIIRLHRLLGNRWSLIAGRMPGRTDNEIKNYWNTHLKKRFERPGINPIVHQPLFEDKAVTEKAVPASAGGTTTSGEQQENSAFYEELFINDIQKQLEYGTINGYETDYELYNYDPSASSSCYDDQRVALQSQEAFYVSEMDLYSPNLAIPPQHYSPIISHQESEMKAFDNNDQNQWSHYY